MSHFYILNGTLKLCFNVLILRSIDNIQEGIGIQAGNVLRDLTTFIFGIVLAFTISWKLALAVIALLPFLSLLAALNIAVCFHLTTYYRESMKLLFHNSSQRGLEQKQMLSS